MGTCCSAEFSHKGQLTGWLSNTLGIRYIPELHMSIPSESESPWDMELQFNTVSSIPIDTLANLDPECAVSLYRWWFRYTTDQFETRIGLQKINFGPARILRSLRWFDSLDTNDPLQLTTGVTGVLARYFFVNNANMWVWGLFGNTGLKGSETYLTADNTMEWGGRYQHPVPLGEMALSVHRRQIEYGERAIQNRVAIDGQWDVGVGLWLEAVFQETSLSSLADPWQTGLTVGGDYTVDVGTGLHVSLETMVVNTTQTLQYTAMMIDASVSIIDTISLILNYDHQQQKITYTMSWQGTYDDWNLHLSVYSDGIQGQMTYNY